ncbi:trypsin alpha-3-like isoform X3 [Schistocerca cancellata]|uniref:trypsin alpha-3-like isoform X3 n=1 Tax=Schistocerca cancellata TaxID=274614 RepID=UPI002117BBC6|nr:trypsin alpha-3-like isoform X3 [Schistocerca cancellata]
MFRTALFVLLVVALSGASPLVKPIPGSKPWRSRLDGRIVGGSAVSISQYPWQLYFTIGNYMCGASIISNTWALSAAHCVDGYSTNQMLLRAGTSTRGSGGTTHNIATGYIHSSYSDPDYDIAVVQVSNAFSFNSNVQAVSLTSSEPSAGTSVTVTGWGATSSGGSASNTLLAVTVQIIDRNTCNRSYGYITSRMICAGVTGGGKDSCQGDSGGPLVSGSTQVGIVSFGNGCALANYPGVYTNVANLRSWIQQATGV